MKKVTLIVAVLLLSTVIFLLGFNYSNHAEPHTYYQVYLDDELLGTIKSKKALEDYINERGDYYKKKYDVDTVYAPNGLEIKKIVTYHNETSKVRDIYKQIEKRKSFTVQGYEFTIKQEKESQKINVIQESTFKNAIENTIKTFVGSERYEQYQNNTQPKISTTGRIIENIYIDQKISIKETTLPVDDKIYTDEDELSKYILFGSSPTSRTYTVQAGDTIEKVAFSNEISVEEFLISNPEFTDKNNLLFPGQEVIIGTIDPQVDVVVEEHVVEDKESDYQTEIRYDESKLVGDDEIIQAGQKGVERVTQKEKLVNGFINYVDPKNKEVIKPAVNEILVKGEKYIPTVGSTTNWLWPTNSGWTISSDYGYRIFGGAREAHLALDISGTGYGSPIYAVTNGVVYESRYRYPDGNYVCINHNNGYYTCYAHMERQAVSAGQTVERGQIIGYVGQSGLATGPHVHFEVWRGGRPWYGGTRINPWSMY